MVALNYYSNQLHVNRSVDVWYEVEEGDSTPVIYRPKNVTEVVDLCVRLKNEHKKYTIFRCQREEVTWTLGSGSC
jgi:hypothetical protein